MTDVVAVAASQPAAEPSPRFQFLLLGRLLRKRIAVVCLIYLAAVALIAIIAPLALPDVKTQRIGNFAAVQQGPSSAHWLGTDTVGRDVLQRLLVGTRPTVLAAIEAVAVALLLGVPLGLAAGYLRGRTDRTVGFFVDLMLALPGIVLILAVLAVFPGSTTAAMVTLGVLAAPGFARVVRSAVLPVREELYIAAANVSGLSNPYIIVRHVLPRIAGPIIVQTALLAATALVVQSGLAFLQLIGEPPAPSWGGMIQDGIQVIVSNSWLIWPPGIVLAMTILALGLLGDSVRDATTEAWTGTERRRDQRPTKPRVVTPVTVGSPAEDGLAVRHPFSPTPPSQALLSVENLNIAFYNANSQLTRVVQDATFEIRAGEILGLVGESGCGKSVTAMALIRGLAGGGVIESGRIVFAGKDITAMSEREYRQIRGKEIAVISQEPTLSLNPVFRVGWQLTEVVHRHTGKSGRAAREYALDLLRQARLPNAEEVFRRYPHELSGGMAQRVVIARALAGDPRLLIADEPTTALDMTVQAEILDLLRQLSDERSMAILLITHDWGVVADLCDRAVVMYAGQVTERAAVETLFDRPRHPYTAGLLASNPHLAEPATVLQTIPGSVPRPEDWPIGCHFAARCPFATAECREAPIPLLSFEGGQQARCIHHEEVVAAGGWPSR